MEMMNNDGASILSVEDWLNLAPPQGGRKHWKDGRSAKELAKAWFKSGTCAIPEELSGLLDSNPITKGFVPELGVAELIVELDDCKPGNTRNTDLFLMGKARGLPIAVSIEAKADEPFGEMVGKHREQALRKSARSKVPRRIELLLQQMFGRPPGVSSDELPYQLLHASAASLIEAANREAQAAVFVVHEFLSQELDPEKVEHNARGFSSFVRFFPELSASEPLHGELLGPVRVPGGKFVPADVDLLIGKVATYL